MKLPSREQHPRRRKGSKRRSSQYLVFGTKSTICLSIFSFLYFFVMLCLQPMLQDSVTHDATTLRGAMKSVHKPHVRDGLKHAKDVLARKKVEFVSKIKDRVGRKKGDVGSQFGSQDSNSIQMEKSIMDEAWKKFLKASKAKYIQEDEGTKTGIAKDQQMAGIVEEQQKEENPGGFIVLGMHRSGTSMLSGLLVEGFGYNPGEPLIQPAFDNEKGFYELIPVVLQNDIFLRDQRANWAGNVVNYDSDEVLDHYKKKLFETFRAEKSLAFFNQKASMPWLQKDPRMCITLKTWIPLFDTPPAIIFTYRHPIEVAMSLRKREEGFTLERGIRLWINYNIAAFKNSAGLCRVLSSSNALLADPLGETIRISEELTSRCNVPSPPKMITKAVVDGFVDTSLQHNKKELDKKSSEEQILEKLDDCEEGKDLNKFGHLGPGKDREMELYSTAMKLYCDFQSGKAFKEDYQWPSVGH